MKKKLFFSLLLSSMALPVLSSEVQEPIEKLQVTGSRLKQIDIEGAMPLTVFDQSDFEVYGASTLGDFLATQSSLNGTESENIPVFHVRGSSSAGAKGLQGAYVLYLLNGHRISSNPIAKDFVDLSLLPVAAIERIEYLREGASAVYGSDAVAGVVNVITHSALTDTTINITSGVGIEHGDGNEVNLSLTSGWDFGYVQSTLALQYLNKKAIPATDRDLSRSAERPDWNDSRSFFGYPGSIQILGGPFLGNFLPYVDCPEEDRNSTNSFCLEDFAVDYPVRPKTERFSLYNQWQIDTDASYTRLHLSYAKNRIPQSINPAPDFLDVTQSPFLSDYLHTLLDQDDAESVMNDPNRFVRVARRLHEFGGRQQRNQNQGINVGLTSEFELAGGDVELSLTASRTKVEQKGVNGFVLRNSLVEAINAGQFNPFVQWDCEIDYAPGFCEQLQYQMTRDGSSRLQMLSVNYRRDLGAQMQYVMGLDYRKESFSDRPDEALNKGQVLGAAGSDGAGKRKNIGLFSEWQWQPLENMSWNLALRWDEASWQQQSRSKLTGRAGMSWQISSEIKLRASYGNGFKAPDLHQLYKGVENNFVNAVDRHRCATVGNNDPTHSDCQAVSVFTLNTGNIGLSPEESLAFNMGAIWAPGNHHMELNYWTLSVDNIIGQLSVQDVLDHEQLYADFINRVDGVLYTSGAVVETSYLNLNQQSAKGINFKYSTERNSRFGTFGLNFTADYLHSLEKQNSPFLPLCDVAGKNALPKLKANLAGHWQHDRWLHRIGVRYVGKSDLHFNGGPDADCQYAEAARDVSSYQSWNITTHYQWQNNLTLTLSVDNVFDKNPPLSNAGWPFYDQRNYDHRGRFVLVGVQWQWQWQWQW